MVVGEQMFPLSLGGRIDQSHPYSLCQNKGFMEFIVFLVWWVMDAFSSVRETLLLYQGSFVGKKRKRVWIAAPLCLF